MASDPWGYGIGDFPQWGDRTAPALVDWIKIEQNASPADVERMRRNFDPDPLSVPEPPVPDSPRVMAWCYLAWGIAALAFVLTLRRLIR